MLDSLGAFHGIPWVGMKALYKMLAFYSLWNINTSILLAAIVLKNKYIFTIKGFFFFSPSWTFGIMLFETTFLIQSSAFMRKEDEMLTNSQQVQRII